MEGDFNLVLDLEKRQNRGLAKTHHNSVKIIQQFSEKLDLADAWRVLHTETSTAWKLRFTET